MAPLQLQMILSPGIRKKGNRGKRHGPSNFAALPLEPMDISKTVAQLLRCSVPCAGTAQPRVQGCSNLLMKYSPTNLLNIRNSLARLPRNSGRALIWAYRHSLSLLVGYNCRHLPTCSVYGDEAIERFGLWGGGWMTLARLLRCHPWGSSGIDNVPLTRPEGATWYLPWRFGKWRAVNGS